MTGLSRLFAPLAVFRSPKLDLPFARDDANRYLPWVIAFMVFMVSMILCVGASLGEAVMAGDQSYRDAFTVQIPPDVENVDQKVAQLTKLFVGPPGVPGVVDVVTYRNKDVKDLIEPWLGSGASLDALPLPTLLEVKLEEGKTVNFDKLRPEILAIVPGAEIDDHKAWMARFSRFIHTVQTIAYLVAGLIILVTAVIIMLSARTALRLHTRTVDLLHSMGAQDKYIVRQFQTNTLMVAMKGALAGTFVAVLLYAVLAAYSASFESPLLPSLSLQPTQLALFFAVPLCMVLIAGVTTRMSVFSILKNIH